MASPTPPKWSLYQTLSRRKTFEDEPEIGKEKLKRVLNVFDLSALGIGATLGCSVYVLAGMVAESVAGPAVVLCFLIAAIVSSFAGVCYAELAGRVPGAGSAYVYTYVVVGEFIAFIIGWVMLIEQTIGTALAAKAITKYVDALLGYPYERLMHTYFPFHKTYLNRYLDVNSFLFILTITLIVAWGVRKSSALNGMCTIFNLLTVGTVVVSGLFFVNPANWSIPKSAIPFEVDGGIGGFIPFGWAGVVAGAAHCFYGFTGFRCISTTGEETKNPKKTIPMAIVISLLFVTIVYISLASVLTLMWPYYDLDLTKRTPFPNPFPKRTFMPQFRTRNVFFDPYFQDPDAPFSAIYEKLGLPIIRYMIIGGAMFALFSSLIGCLFPLPRIVYAMSSDGLLFGFLSKINEKTQTPFVATMVCGAVAGILSAVCNIVHLVRMMFICTLVTYLIVCVCVLLLRYRDNNTMASQELAETSNGFFHKCFNLSNTKVTNYDTEHVSIVLITVYSTPLSATLMLIIVVMLYRQPQAKETLTFKVPFVPLVPCLSIIFNLYLMMEQDDKTWVMFGVALLLGVIIYVFYGANHSLECVKQRSLREQEDPVTQKEIFSIS